MDLFDFIGNDLLFNTVKYIVCIAGIVAAFLHLGDQPKRKFLIAGGAALIMTASILNTVVQYALYASVFRGATGIDDYAKYRLLTRILTILTGLANAMGIGALILGAILDRLGKRSSKAIPAKSRRRRDEEDDAEEDEEERPRKKKPRRTADEDED